MLYQSMRRPSPMARWIAPHALAFDGLRWHVRAWCHENGEFRDFVVSRVQRVDAARQARITADADQWWNTYVDIRLRPRSTLTEAQKFAIQSDYGMTDDLLTLRCRKALAFYLLRQLQLLEANTSTILAQPLELVNREELSEVIASGKKGPQSSDLVPRNHTENDHA